MNDWDNYFLQIADVVATRSTCPSRQVGCVVVDSETKAIVSTGYNGAPRGTAHCDERCLQRRSGQDWQDCKAIHAEINAITNAALNGVSTNCCTMYLPCTPCIMCARVIVNAGIERVACREIYPHPETFELFKEAGIPITLIQGVTDELE